MLQRHLGTPGEGRAGTLTATLEGTRRSELTAAGLVVRNRGHEIGVGVAFVADPLVLVVVGGGQPGIHWSLLPGGPSVTARADGLRLIRGLAAGGQLTFRLRSEPFPPIDVGVGAWDDEDEWRLFEDLAVLEEWSGMSLPMPKAVTADEATLAAQAANWARTQQIDARIGGAISFTASDDLAAESIDELRLLQEFDINLVGTWIPLGEGTASVPLGATDRENSDERVYRAWPAQPDVCFALRPPPTRRLPARRTQPDEIRPPTSRTRPQPPPDRRFVRPARRRLSDVLAARRSHPTPSPDHDRGTAGILDDIRGE